jgi:hypothetical protein
MRLPKKRFRQTGPYWRARLSMQYFYSFNGSDLLLEH